MKNKKTILIAIIAILVLAGIFAGVLLVKKYMPSNRQMSLQDYFQLGEGEVELILQDEISESRGLLVDGQVYVDFDLVHDTLNSRFYWDGGENLLLYTTSTAVISATTGSTEYYTNKSKDTKDYVIVRVMGDRTYIALDYVKDFTALDYVKYDDPDRVVITYRYDESFDYTKVKKKTKLRYGSSIKSDILLSLNQGDEVLVLDQDVKDSQGESTGFMKVMSADGVIGFISAKKKSGESYQKAFSTDFKEEKYSHTLLDGKVSLVWHQVTTSAANDGILNLLNATKGVNVVAPTWFSVSGNQGEITSLASDLYVSRARTMGAQVWGVCNDFSSDSKIGKVLGSTTTRQKLEKNLIAEAIKYSLDGINIDFEYVKKESGDDFIQFIRELGIMCRNNGIILSIDNYPPTSYSEYYNRREQAAVADYVITMAYDEYFAGSEEAGPVSSLTFVEESTANTLEQVPAEQTIIALPFYSRLWKETTKDGEVKVSSEAYSMTNAKTVMTDEGAEFNWDDATGMNYAEYKKDGAVYKMWLEDATSLEEKMKAATEKDVAGLAFWKLGLDNSSVWDTIIKYTG